MRKPYGRVQSAVAGNSRHFATSRSKGAKEQASPGQKAGEGCALRTLVQGPIESEATLQGGSQTCKSSTSYSDLQVLLPREPQQEAREQCLPVKESIQVASWGHRTKWRMWRGKWEIAQRLQMTQFRSFLWLSDIPLYICTTSSLSIHLSMGI